MASGQARPLHAVIRFGDFALDPARGTLVRSGVRLKLQPQPLRVLEMLLEKAPGIVSREEIQRDVWGKDANVDVEQSLNFCIRQIRVAIVDGSKEPRYIETIPRVGYRFIAPVFRERANAEIPAVLDPEPPAPAQTVPVGSLPFLQQKRLRKWLSVGALGIVLVVTGVGGFRWATLRRGDSHAVTVSYLTTYPGDELDPSLSPDGSQVAFSWSGSRHDNRDIYVLPVGGQNPLRLTQDPREDTSPAWSPDGHSIAFLRRHKDDAVDIMLIPALGGPERSLSSIHLFQAGTEIPQRTLAWSPNGKWLIFTQSEPSGSSRLSLLSLASGAIRPAFQPSGNPIPRCFPSFFA